MIFSKEKFGLGELTLENAHEGILHNLVIRGTISLDFPQSTSNIYGTTLVPNDLLKPSNSLTPSSPVPYQNAIIYPSSTLYTKSPILLIDDTEYELDIDFFKLYR